MVIYQDPNNSSSTSGQLFYEWHDVASGGTTILQSSGAVYILTNAAIGPRLQVQVVAQDALGYRTTVVKPAEFSILRTEGTAAINPPTSYAPSSSLTVSVTYSQGGRGNTTYQWQYVSESGSVDIDRAILSTFVLTSIDLNTNFNIRAIAIHTNIFDDVITITTAPILINQPPIVNAAFVQPTGTIGIGSQISITGAVQDANNLGGGNSALNYIWRNAAGDVLPSGNSAVYTLQNANTIGLEVVLGATDDLGYVSSVVIPFVDVAKIIQPYAAEAVNIFGIMDSQAIVGAFRSHLDNVSSEPLSALPSPFAVQINGTDINDATDFSRAFLTQGQKPFAIKDFALSYHSGKNHNAGSDWSAWMRTGRSYLEGNPLLSNGETYSYSGDSFGIYGGFDRQIGHGWRLGFGGGGSSATIKGTIVGQTEAEQIERHMQTLLPYLEWINPDGGGKVRLISGFGKGNMLIKSACTADLKASWILGSAAGEYQVFNTNAWEGSVIGDISYSESKIDSGTCGDGLRFSAIRQHGGEWQLGGRAKHERKIGASIFSPHLGIDMRRQFENSAKDDIAFDVLAGLLWNEGFSGFSIGVEGRKQINSTTHRRTTISGNLTYNRFGFNSAVRSGFDDDKGAVHRWQLRYQDGRNFNSIGTEFYIEHAPALANGETTLGGNISLTF